MGAFYIIDLFRGSDIVVSSNQNDSKIIYYYSSPDPVPINSIHIKCKIISNNNEKPSLFAKMDFYGQPVNLYIYENVKFRITIGKNNYVLPFVVNRKNELSYLLRVPEDISNAKFATKVVMETSIYKSVYIKVPIREKTIDVPPVIYYY